MSCGSCYKNRADFSSQKNTWSPKSDLTMSKGNPFPELQNPKNCYGSNSMENYCGGKNSKMVNNKLDTNYSPLQRTVITENYIPDKNPSNYANLNSTWSEQKIYNL